MFCGSPIILAHAPQMVPRSLREVCIIDHEGQVGLLTSHTNTRGPQQAATLSTQREDKTIRRRLKVRMYSDYYGSWFPWTLWLFSSQLMWCIEQSKLISTHMMANNLYLICQMMVFLQGKAFNEVKRILGLLYYMYTF